MCEHLKKMGLWTSIQAEGLPLADGYEIDVTEFDFRDDGGVCYDKDGVKVTHWRRSHAVDGASAYRLDWNGLSFVWTGDGKPDQLTAKYAKGVDVFVTEMVVDNPNLWALKQGCAPAMGAITLDNFHTTHYAVGYLSNLVQPRLAMATHVSFDREMIGEMMAGVRMHYKGMFAFGIDHTVVNITKDRVWLREAALPETTNTRMPDMQTLFQDNFGGKIPAEMTIKSPFLPNQEQLVRDLEIDPALFTPKDQMRRWARLPAEMKVNTAELLSGPPAKK
jgi:ribonuclease Z